MWKVNKSIKDVYVWVLPIYANACLNEARLSHWRGFYFYSLVIKLIIPATWFNLLTCRQLKGENFPKSLDYLPWKLGFPQVSIIPFLCRNFTLSHLYVRQAHILQCPFLTSITHIRACTNNFNLHLCKR